MVAPLSDWFTRISNFPIYDAVNDINNVNVIKIPLYALDAGTAQGTMFVTMPKHHELFPKNISLILPGETDLFPLDQQEIEPIAFLEIRGI